MNASLILVKQDGSQKEVPLRAGVSVLGRDTEASIRIPSSGVSRRHCEFRVQGSDVVLRDLSSSNGTYVNGQKIDERALKAGDAIAIHEFVFVLRVNGQPAAIDAGVRDRALPKVADDAEDSFFGPSAPPAARPAAGAAKGPAPAKAPADPDDSGADAFNFDDLLDDEKDMPKL